MLPDSQPVSEKFRLATNSLLIFPMLLGVLAIAAAAMLLPKNFAVNQPSLLESTPYFQITVAYFVFGSLVGAIPILRSARLRTTWKFVVAAGYVLGSLLVLYLCYLAAILTTVVI